MTAIFDFLFPASGYTSPSLALFEQYRDLLIPDYLGVNESQRRAWERSPFHDLVAGIDSNGIWPELFGFRYVLPVDFFEVRDCTLELYLKC